MHICTHCCESVLSNSCNPAVHSVSHVTKKKNFEGRPANAFAKSDTGQQAHVDFALTSKHWSSCQHHMHGAGAHTRMQTESYNALSDKDTVLGPQASVA